MKPSLMLDAIKVCLMAGRAPFIEGPPGSAKTELVKLVARELDHNLLALDLSMIYDPVDTRGIPCNVDGHTVWLPPDYMVMNGHPTIVFLDDLPTAPPTSQANLFSLVLDHRLGGHPLPKSCRVLAAGNRVSDSSAAHAVPAAMANRFTWLRISVDQDDWCGWGLANGIRTEVLAYHRFTGGGKLYPMYNSEGMPTKCGLCQKNLNAGELCGSCLHSYRAFPSPRTWEFVSQMLDQKPRPEIEFDLIAGNIGIPSATEFVGYLTLYRALPSLDAILMGPTTAPVPKDPAALYAVATALGRRATSNNLDAVTAYLDRLPPEFGVLTMRDAKNRDMNILNCRAAISWMTRNNDVLL